MGLPVYQNTEVVITFLRFSRFHGRFYDVGNRQGDVEQRYQDI